MKNDYAQLSQNALTIVRQCEKDVRDQTGEDIILVAYSRTT